MEEFLSEHAVEIYCEVHMDETSGGLANFGHSFTDAWEFLGKNHFNIWEIPLRKDSAQSSIRKINYESDIIESTMLYASNVH